MADTTLSFGGDPSKNIAPSTYTQSGTTGAYTQVATDPNAVTGTPSTTTSPVTTSSGTRLKVDSLGNNISTAESGTFDIQGFLDKYLAAPDSTTTDATSKLLADRQAQLEKRRTDEIARLTSTFDTEKALAEQRQTKDLEPINRKLELLKGSQIGDMEEQLQLQRDKLVQANKLELQQLFNQRENYIAQARNAFEDADFALAESQLKNAQATQKAFYERQKDAISMALAFSQENRQQQQFKLQQQKEANDQEQARLKILSDQGIVGNFYKYAGSDSVYSSQNPGVVLTPEQYKALGGVGQAGGWKDVQVVSSQAENKYVATLAAKYGDTVFPTMTAEQAQKAMQYSRIYQDEIRPPKGPAPDTFKFSSSDTTKLLGVGLSMTQVSAIQQNLINGYSIDEILTGFNLNTTQSRAVKEIMGNQQSNETYDKNFGAWVWQNYTREQLIKAAKNRGLGKNPDEYVKLIEKKAQQFRDINRSDQDIIAAFMEIIDNDIK